MKYCHHCGKPVTDEMCFCAECGTELIIKKELPIATQKDAFQEEAKIKTANKVEAKTMEKDLGLFLKEWQKDSPKNKFIAEKLAKIINIFTIIWVMLIVVILATEIPSIAKINNNETLPQFIIQERTLKKIKSTAKTIVYLLLFGYIITAIPDANRFIRISMADFIKKENLSSREIIKTITLGEFTVEEYVGMPTKSIILGHILADSVFIASSEKERGNFKRENLYSIALRLICVISLAAGLLILLPSIAPILGGFSKEDLLIKIVKQPLFYISIICFIGNILFCSKMEKDRKQRKIKWLKNEASDLFIKTK